MSQIYEQVDIQRARNVNMDSIPKKLQSHNEILLDTNVLVRLLSEPAYCYNFLMSQKDSTRKFVTIDKMWSELEKISGIKEHVAKFMLSKTIGQIQTIRSTGPLQEMSFNIQMNTSNFCHWPDSLLVAVSKKLNWSICTHDSDLIKTAKKMKLKLICPKGSGILPAELNV